MNQARDEPVNEWVKKALKGADFREKSVTKKGSFFCDSFRGCLGVSGKIRLSY